MASVAGDRAAAMLGPRIILAPTLRISTTTTKHSATAAGSASRSVRMTSDKECNWCGGDDGHPPFDYCSPFPDPPMQDKFALARSINRRLWKTMDKASPLAPLIAAAREMNDVFIRDLEPPIRPAPIITVPNWPETSVTVYGGVFTYYQVCRRGGLVISRTGDWT